MLAVEFGSSRRGDSNPTSDRDILVLGSDWNEVNAEAESRALEGYSVSTFLFDKASHLTKSGNLFFKHIYDEGVLVSGSEACFKGLASKWRVARDYSDEARQNIDMLEVLHHVPRTNTGILAAIDIMVSSSRNILIRRLAHDSICVFSWRKIFSEAKRRNMIRDEDVPVLLYARCLKNIYRQGYTPKVPIRYFRLLVNAASRACGISIRPRFSYRREMLSFPERFLDGTYKQLRAFELMSAQYPLDEGLGSFIHLVGKPSYFCAIGPNHSFKPPGREGLTA